VGVIRSWNSRWFAGRNFADLLNEDVTIKRYISKRLENAGLANVEILRAPKRVTVDIHTSRPGIVIGRKGSEVDKLREELQLLTKKDITLNIIEVKKPELSAKLVANSIARQLEGRVSFRRAMKKSLGATMKMGAEGIKIVCAGRLGGAEIARAEKYHEGRVPLHTLRADIDYATATAATTYGCIGVKVWICRGEVLDPWGKMAGDKLSEEAESRLDARLRESGKTDRSRRRRKRPPKGKVRKVLRKRPHEGNAGDGKPAAKQGGPPPRQQKPKGPSQGGAKPKGPSDSGAKPKGPSEGGAKAKE
jgi:small subunit ribosomal protein S3